MLKKRFSLCLLGLSIIMIAGCATLVGGGPTQEINISSAPEGAEIWTGKLKNGKLVDLVNTGEVTPSNVTIRRTGTVVVLKMDGFKDTNVVLTRSINGWFFGNIIIGGLLGSSIDLSTGSSQRFDPDNFFVDMVPEAEEASGSEESESNSSDEDSDAIAD